MSKQKRPSSLKGIYQYRDLKTSKVVYIGKDSYINKNKRHKHHLQPSAYNKQPFNRVLQNNPTRYQYEIIYIGDFDDDLLNTLEINSIAEENPKFNFTKGGDGTTGYKHSDDAKRKISENNPCYWKSKTFPKKVKEKIREANLGEKNHNWKNYARIIKKGKKRQKKQQYAIQFNGKQIKQSVYLDKLKKWFNENYPNEELKIEGDIIAE